MFATEYETTSSSSLSSRRSSTTTLSDACLSDELALIECIEIIEANVEDPIINKANEKEKKWWIDGNYKTIDGKKLPLILMEDVSYDEFEKKCERANASKFWEYRDGTVIIIELPMRDHEVAHGEFADQFKEAFYNLPRQDRVRNIGTTTCYASGRKGRKGSKKQSDVSFVPKGLPNPAQYPSDPEGNPWPTIICETANTQSLQSIIQKTTQFWLAPHRVEDVIVLKLWPWNSISDQNKSPLRRLTVQFCRRTSPRDARGNFQPVHAIEFGTIDSKNQPFNGCSALGRRTLSISPDCIYKGCDRQNPPLSPFPLANDVVIDLFYIQQEIFAVMKKS
ncbi:4690_t:CDS:2 [Funneliformis geosporum]|nr:4690_t:CDS:2 [Funneliformis geosporum]